MSSLPCSHISCPTHRILHLYSGLPQFHSHKPHFLQLRSRRISVCFLSTSCHCQLSPCLVVAKPQERHNIPKLRTYLLRVVGASVILFLGLGICTRSASACIIPPNHTAYPQETSQQQTTQGIIHSYTHFWYKIIILSACWSYYVIFFEYRERWC